MTFGRLFVFGLALGDRWICLCECGSQCHIARGNLISGHTKSCGCLKNRKKHGLVKSPEYSAWHAMIQRCHNPRHPNYVRYGARGITVCDKWRANFLTFYSDVGPRPGANLSLERIDNNGGYEPGNVRWATGSEQMRNTSHNHWIEIDGVRKVIAQWAIEKDIHFTTIAHRIARGMSERDAVMIPPKLSGRRASKGRRALAGR